MKISVVISSLLCFILMACGEVKKQAPFAREKKIEFQIFEIADSSNLPGENVQTTVNLHWIEFIHPDSNQSQINFLNKKVLCDAFSYLSDSSLTSSKDQSCDLKKCARLFIGDYESSSENFGDDTPWEMSIALDTCYLGQGLISFSKHSYTDTGGAHGFEGIYFLHYDLATGSPKDIKEYFSDTLALSRKLEEFFRKDQNLSANQPLTDAGLFSDLSNNFPIPSECAFTQKGFIAVYNAYDIAPYAAGRIVIEIPLGELLPLLKTGKLP